MLISGLTLKASHIEKESLRPGHLLCARATAFAVLSIRSTLLAIRDSVQIGFRENGIPRRRVLPLLHQVTADDRQPCRWDGGFPVGETPCVHRSRSGSSSRHVCRTDHGN